MSRLKYNEKSKTVEIEDSGDPVLQVGIEPVIIRDGSHVNLNMGNTQKLRKDFKTSGTK